MFAAICKVPISGVLTRVLVCSFFCTGAIAIAQQLPSENSLRVESPQSELQVAAKILLVYEAPRENSPVIARLERGSMLNVLEQQGEEWFRIKLATDGATGWVRRTQGEYGDMTVSVFPAKAPAGFASDFIGTVPPDSRAAIVKARPGAQPLITTLPPIDVAQVGPPQANLPRESISIPDRWRLMQNLGVKFPLYDPYNQNPLKGDLPVFKNLGPDYFFNLGVISDTLFEFRRLPTPVAGQIAIAPGANDVFGEGRQSVFAQNLILSFSLIKGNTTFKPPDFEFRFVPVLNFNRVRVEEAGVLRIDPTRGTTRNDNFVGVQELFGDVHLRNVSDRYDFDSLRVGIQPFISDFRGFLFQDSPFGVRLFGNRSNNQYQYNLAWFRRVEKDTNSGLNDISTSLRSDDLFVANLFRQDWPVLGFTSQISAIHNRNNETKKFYDTNGFLVRPAVIGDIRSHAYQVTYFGYSGDGHFGPWNLTTSTYLAYGKDEYNPVAHRSQRIQAGFHATELSRDFSWIRVRGNFLMASGDKDPYDDKASGFDAIFENPQFAGAETSFYIRQPLPLIGGGGVALAGRNSILPSLRSSKDQGQSNFVNPGLALVGVGADFDIKPELRLFSNISYLRFMNVNSLSALRNEAIPSNSLGVDISAGFHWRPFFTQNLVINGSVAALRPGDGLKALYGTNQGTLYSILLNAILTF